MYKSSALALDFGICFQDKNKLTRIGFAAKNMGFQIKSYGNQKEDLPFDIQLGVSKKLKIPVWISATAHRLHQFKLKDFVLATQVDLTNKINFTIGYNNVRKQELNITNSQNGLTAFSLGTGILFSKLQTRYAITYYQAAAAYNQLGINFHL